MKSLRMCCCVLIALLIGSQSLLPAEPELRPWPENPWYWSYRGRPVLLLGGSDDDNLFQWPQKELIAHLDRMKGAGGNYIRNTMSDRPDAGFEVYPFEKQANGKYDLERWNDEYWTRFERLLRETAQRDIIIQIEVWDRFDYTDSRGRTNWQLQPYNPKNNVNYTCEESGFAERYPDHPGENRQPFFFTTPKQQNNQVVLRYQQRFVDRMLEHSLKYDHVLYCMDNETNGEETWSRYWAEYIKSSAEKRGKAIQLTEMWDAWDLTAEVHKRTFDHPGLYSFVDVSQNNHNTGQKHWDNFLHVREYLSKQPRPMNTTKIYGADTYRFGTDEDGIERFWRHLLAGAASVRFHRPPAGLGLDEKAMAGMLAARKLESLVNLWDVEPANHLLSDRKDNEAFLAAKSGHVYVIYFTDGGSVNVDLNTGSGKWQVRWIDVSSGEWGKQAALPSGASAQICAPSEGGWVAVITK